MQSVLKVREKGFWLYKEREIRLGQALKIAPIELEGLLGEISSFFRSQTDSGLLKQVAGSLDGLGSMLNLKVGSDSLDDREKISMLTSFYTKFDSYQDVSLLSQICQRSDSNILNGLTTSQIVRQVGLNFISLQISLKFYSSTSSVSRWFRVPKEEGRICLSLDKAELNCIATVATSLEEWSGKFVVKLYKLIFEILKIKIDSFENYLDFTKPIQKV